jgi:ATP-dependent helicase HrpB
LLAREVAAGTCPLKNWDNAVEQWIVRVNCVAAWFPDLAMPTVGEAEKLLMIEEVCRDAVSYKEIKDRPVWAAVKSWLTGQQQALIEQLAPERIALPNGRKAKITYHPTTPPTVAARIQDLYGVQRNLTIGRGRVPLVMQVLAPNHRPIQITSDLEGFWRDAYPKIKKELQRKYPKHEWR